jgi:CPA2 family monovalent cation:H+ antiporter-2
LHGWLQRRRLLLAWLEGRNNGLTLRPNGTDKIRDHAIVVGYGRVGSLIGEALARAALPYVVVERDLELVERLRARGLTVVYGDALTPGVLEGAHVECARLLVVAAPGGFQGGEMVRRARHVNLDIDTLARSHSDEETVFLRDSGAGIALMGERELALSMMSHALQTMGVDEDKAQRTMQDIRSMYSLSASISTQSVILSG